MPLGLLRLNERRQRPNQNISFIKVADGPEKEIAEDILERIAAIVWPIMRDNGLGVMTLEDFPPNREFWGRNFNAGECIQLVLKSPMTGLWLPFSFVCKVMLHELAHIKQMNHSKAFHAVRIGYHKEFDALVAKGYTGEGFWSRGHTMSEDLTAPRHLSEAEMPDNLCGGTYRSAKKPEKRKLTYAERKERRKVKLFGKGEGDKMGANEALRASLEKGKSKKAISVKPRVAQSQRGRDLRMEAALRREKASQAESSTSAAKKEESGSDSGDTEYETEEEEGTVDVGGGNRMVRVASEGEDGDEWAEFKDELNDMCSATALSGSKSTSSTAGSSSQKPAVGAKAKPSISQRNGKRKMEADDSETEKSDSEDDIVIVTSRKRTAFNEGVARRVDASDNDDTTPPPPPRKVAKTGLQKNRSPPGVVSPKAEESENDALPPALPKGPTASTVPRAPVAPETRTDARLPSPGLTSCAVCTMENMPDLALCAVCGNVLNTIRTPSWKCPTPACLSTGYSNPNDAAICGCCGARRPT